MKDEYDFSNAEQGKFYVPMHKSWCFRHGLSAYESLAESILFAMYREKLGSFFCVIFRESCTKTNAVTTKN